MLWKLLQLFSITLLMITGSYCASGQDAIPVEIVVTGKQPGPPMWRVINGDNTLYIFAWLSPIPKNIFWESERVEAVIAQAQEYIPMPDADVSVSPLVMFNPINIFRGARLGKRLTRNEDKATLEEVLPADLYARYSRLKTRYFPREKDIDMLRPLVAGRRMMDHIEEAAGLSPAKDVGKKIRRLVRRNRNITVTEVTYETRLKGGFRDLANRVETMLDSMPWEKELSCFERQLSIMEEDIEEMQYRASTWAQGYIEEFKFIPLPGDEDDDCTQLIANSSEREMYEDITGSLEKMWLEAARNALANNEVTFAVLEFNELLLEDGLLNQLKKMGYEVIEP